MRKSFLQPTRPIISSATTRAPQLHSPNDYSYKMAYRMLLYLHRKEGISHAEFKDHYEYIHIPLTRELTGSLFPSLHARRYIARAPAEDGSGDAPVVLVGDKTADECDAVVEVAFKDEEAAQAFFAATNSGEVGERLRKDNEQFLDWSKLKIMRISETFETRREG